MWNSLPEKELLPMASRSRNIKRDKPSINYWRTPLDVRSLDTSVSLLNEHTDVAWGKAGRQSENKSPNNRLKTSQLVSAVAGIWNFVGHPAVLQTRESFKCHDIGQNANNMCSMLEQTKHNVTSADTAEAWSCFSTAKSTYEDHKALKKMLLFASSKRVICNSSIWNLVRDTVSLSYLHTSAIDKAENTKASAYQNSPLESMSKQTNYLPDDALRKDNESESHTNSPLANFSIILNEATNFKSACQDSLGGMYANVGEVQQDPISLPSTYSFQPTTSTKEATVVLGNQISGDIKYLTSSDCGNSLLEQLTDVSNSSIAVGGSVLENSADEDRYVHKSDRLSSHDVGFEEYTLDNELSTENVFRSTIVMNRHALAGAMAGTLVSLCLHPVDTVKTIIQANCTCHSSFYEMLRRTTTERGLSGLYRGITSKLASSAPISAIYTVTYESVKGVLLPVFPKEYNSFAHCIAGGCSSIATSFVFTPSERIKQQMQISSQYQTCWSATLGCLKKGGVTSLYAGWSAVLCRNIPHSTIKFYTYENMKQFFMSSAPHNAGLSSWQTLLCGGLAGSTAAFFTTPFDVVKTRMQTQAPGTVGKYDGVLHALQEITKQEGVQGLYRGLSPRLAMYISQGAIFFACYEVFTAVLSLDIAKAPG